jgi:hypothetical protein
MMSFEVYQEGERRGRWLKSNRGRKGTHELFILGLRRFHSELVRVGKVYEGRREGTHER